MSLAMRDAIVAKIKSLNLFREVEPHNGAYDVDDLQRYFRAPPAALVAVERWGDVEITTGVPVLPIEWVVSVVHHERDPKERGDVAMALALRVTSVVTAESRTRWGQTACGMPERIKGRPLFRGVLDDRNALIWGIHWIQPIELTDDVIASLPHADVSELNEINADLGGLVEIQSTDP